MQHYSDDSVVRRPRRLVEARVLWLAVMVVLATAACTGAEGEPSTVPSTSTTAAVSTTTTLLDTGTSSTVARAEPGVECVPGEPKPGIDLRSDDMITFYNQRNHRAMSALAGDGPVVDPSLEPGGPDRYGSVEEWMTAAEDVEDRLSNDGYGFYEPFELFVVRENRLLRKVGIESLSLTLRFWVNQDCEVRVEAGDSLVSQPDPCAYHALYGQDDSGVGCDAPFDPRAGHVAVWTGEEVLIYGGRSGSASIPPLTTGLGFDPDNRAWRSLEPSPAGVSFWPASQAIWTGDEMIVVGRDLDGEDSEIVVMSYSPEDDEWSVSPAPEDRRAVGAVVWTGSEVIMVGGDLNWADSSAWAYTPATGDWRQLPDPDIPGVEGSRGVWTGTEAVFLGGYAHPGSTIAVAYNPGTDTWRQLSEPAEWIQGHELAWTGDRVIVYSGHTGPGHPDRLMVYDPDTDQWSETNPMPIQPSERLASGWTGDRVLMWGGYGTYAEAGEPLRDQGAAYHPETDTWTVLPPSPLDPRCDHSGTWADEEFIVFGGMLTCGQPQRLADGNAASYNFTTGQWELLEED